MIISLAAVPAIADNQPPSVVNNVQASATDGSTVVVTWNKPWDDQGIGGYNIYRNGGYHATVKNDTRFTDQWLGNGNYSYQIVAFDFNNNYSGISDAAEASVGGGGQSSAPLNDGSNTVQTSDASNAPRADAPAVPQNLRGSEVAAGMVRWEWDWVPGAAQYEITVDGNFAGTTTDTHFFSSDLWVGDHSMTVKSITDDWSYSNSSNTLKLYVSGNSAASGESSGNQPAPPPPQQSQPDTGLIDPQSWNYSEVSQKEGYELVFSDEFNGNAINPARWNTQLRWDGEYNGVRYEYRVINNEDQFYINTLSPDPEHLELLSNVHNPFEFDGSRLAIRAIKNPMKTRNDRNGHGPLRDMVAQQHFLSGAITTYDKFTQKYGYFEARIKIPGHVGTFPAFWLHHQKRKWEGTHRSEIDIMENLGHAPWFIYNSFHYHNNVTATYSGDANFLRPEPNGQIYTGTDYSENYHVYAVEWSPDTVTWFIDGQQVSKLVNSNVNHEELYVLLNLAMGGNWTNFPANSGGLGRPDNERYPTGYDLDSFNNPALEIDYVRAYRRK